jgi:hypothetical protein
LLGARATVRADQASSERPTTALEKMLDCLAIVKLQISTKPVHLAGSWCCFLLREKYSIVGWVLITGLF